MAINNNEILKNLKDLKYHSRALNQKLEQSGLSPTDGTAGKEKSTLFDSNVNDIATAVEGLLRGESPERHTLRIEHSIPDAKKNIAKILETKSGKLNLADIEKLKQLLNYFEQVYKQI